MPRRAILHIGPMKTGSSSIQQWLNRNAAGLAAQGVVYPRAFGPNMSRLTGIAEAESFGLALTPLDIKLLSEFKSELEQLKDSDHTLVISGEMLGQLLGRPEQLQIIRRIIDPYVDTFTVIAYLRRQDLLSLSRYSTALRRGERSARPLSTPVDFEKMLGLWAEVFGAENVLPRVYDRNEMKNGDVIADFCEAAGLPFDAFPAQVIQNNQSLSSDAQAFLADLIARLRDSGYKRTFDTVEHHAEIIRFLSARRQEGKGMLPARQDAIDFYEQMRESNEHVRARWFPHKATLFSENFDSYPETATPPPSAEAQRDLAMEVLIEVLRPRKNEKVNPRLQARGAQRDLDEKLLKQRRAHRLGREAILRRGEGE